METSKNPCRGTTDAALPSPTHFTLSRLIIIVLVAAMLLDASVMRGILGFFNQMANRDFTKLSVDFHQPHRTLLQL